MYNSETKVCQNCKASFVIDASDFAFYEKMKVPPPTFCPECRMQRRLMFMNERTLYHRQCDLCHKDVLSVFSTDAVHPVYCNTCWWSDKWDASEYYMDYDPSKNFFDQLLKLLRKVPLMGLYGLYTSARNSDFVNMYSHIKDCYLCTYIDYAEKCLYSSFILRSKDSMDCLMLQNSELCYESVNCHHCYRVFYSLDCEDCNDVVYSRNCRGCSNCFGCVNLVNKSYYIFNEPYSKKDYEKKIQEIKGENPKKLWSSYPKKFIHGRHNANVSGEYIYNSKNTKDSYLAWNMENCRFSQFADSLKDSYDFTNYGDKSELFYEALQCGNQCSKLRFCWWACIGNQNLDYSLFTIGSSDCFGCVGVKKKQYCILNKQYSKEDYEILKEKIVLNMKKDREWGEFFPVSMSPFAYNETTNQEFFPLTKKQAVENGYFWRDSEEKNYSIQITTDQLPDNIKDANDDIVGKVIECAHEGECNEQCTTAFKIIKEELQFYKKMNLPLPRLCPNCRHYQRLKQRNPLKLWHRKCTCQGTKSENGVYENTAKHFHETDHCPNEFETSYAPDRPEIVYCEQCYNAEVV